MDKDSVYIESTYQQYIYICMCIYWFPGGSAVKNLPAMQESESERSTGEGNGNPLLYSCLGNPMDREVWQAIVQGVAKESDTT